jgi:ribosomal protein S18 acetylase RimI-like enzyme
VPEKLDGKTSCFISGKIPVTYSCEIEAWGIISKSARIPQEGIVQIEYVEKGKLDLDQIALLWEKLRNYQKSLSPYFAEHYARRTWTARKTELLEKSRSGHLHTDVAIDRETEKVAGYCIAVVTREGQGHLESIYLEPGYRKHGIGNGLMHRALAWMDEKHAAKKILIVGAGNEQVFSFYSRYGFFPRSIVLEQVKDI